MVVIWEVLGEVGEVMVVKWEVLGEVGEVMEVKWEVLVEVGEVVEGTGEDHLLDPHQEQEVVGKLLIGFAQTHLASRTAMGLTRVSVKNVELQDLAKKELMGLSLFSINL